MAVFKTVFLQLRAITIISMIASFLIPTIYSAFYLTPIIKLLRNLKIHTDQDDKIKLRVLNLPLFSIQISGLGWFIGVGSGIISFSTQYGLSQLDASIKIILVNILVMFLLLSIIYFLIDLLNRTFLIPKVYGEDESESLLKGKSLKLFWRFQIYFLSICIIPMMMFTIIILNNFNSDTSNYSLSSIFVTNLCILIVGYSLTNHIITTLSNPLDRIFHVVEEIKKGNFTSKVKITSNDEIGFLSSGINSMSRELKEKEFMKDTFGKIVDPRVRDLLLSKKLQLGGEERDASILFLDIRGFTSISESLEPLKLVELLNLFFSKMNDCIVPRNGFINKFIGDSILAVFGLPIPDENHAENAVKAAIHMQEDLKILNLEFEKSGFPQLKIGIGVHSGKVIAGNIGTKTRMEYTVIGDTVNIASRIESLCKTYSAGILISEETAKRNPGIKFRSIGDIEIRGREKKVEIFTIL